ncbi:WD domain, g-beta repeat domain-containing protein [Sarocladium implicatum]|nr:WD domain, g-beta repeat domain-containing protein [Sarocladium implicatum]
MGLSRASAKLKGIFKSRDERSGTQHASHEASEEAPVALAAGSNLPIRPNPDHASSAVSQQDLRQRSLWDRAYEDLRGQGDLVAQYEALLGKQLAALQDPEDNGSPILAATQLSRNSDDRQRQLDQIIKHSLDAADNRNRPTIFGHQFIPRTQVARAARLIKTVQGLVTEAVKVSPEASLAWAGVCVLLPVLTNPEAAEEANRTGLTYVTSRVRLYVELEHLLWPESLQEPGLKKQLESLIIELYVHIVEFQIKTVLRFHDTWLTRMRHDILRDQDWEDMVSKVKELERAVRDASDMINTASSRDSLVKTGKVAEDHFATMQTLAHQHLQVSSEHLEVSKGSLREHKRTNEILENSHIIIDLPTVPEASHDSVDFQDSPKCEPGTRERLQGLISDWADEKARDPILWLVGPLGTGKSTIARSITEAFHKEDRVLGSYFFKRGEHGRNDTNRVLPTLALQLARKMPSFKRSLWMSIDGASKDEIGQKGLKSQFDMLLRKPLASLPTHDSALTSQLIIIDALDECERPENLRELITLLYELCLAETLCIRVLLTSRSDPIIKDAFEHFQVSGQVCAVELDDPDLRMDTKADIRTYLVAAFARIRKLRRIAPKGDWPSTDDMDRLVHLSTDPEPLFIYAAILCRFIETATGASPKQKLTIWLGQKPKSQLRQIYEPVLSQAFGGPEAEDFDQKMLFLGALILLATPLSVEAIAGLLFIDPDEVRWWTSALHAVLDDTNSEGVLRPRHKSLSDFLLLDELSAFKVETGEIHATIARRCIERMEASLRQDICGIQQLDMYGYDIDLEIIERQIPADLAYACRYWVHHISLTHKIMVEEVNVFLREHLLHWLEVLSLFGMISSATSILSQLLQIINVSIPSQEHKSLAKKLQDNADVSPGLVDLIRDALRVILSRQSIIEDFPLQIYGTMILFSPLTSIVRQVFWDQRMPPDCVIEGIQEKWDSGLQTLAAHNDMISALEFSPDGQMLASASLDRTIKLWHTSSGLPRCTLRGHAGAVYTLTFAKDSQALVSTSPYDATPWLWDITTDAGAPLQDWPEHRGSHPVTSTFINASQIATAFSDGVIGFWDMQTRTCLRVMESSRPPSPFLTYVKNGIFFVGAGLIAVVPEPDKSTVQLWDLGTGKMQHTLRLSNNSRPGLNHFVPSPDGRSMFTFTYELDGQLWDISTGSPMHAPGIGSKSMIKGAAFSPDSSVIALSLDGKDGICLYDVNEGAVLRKLNGSHLFHAAELSWSPDGQKVAASRGVYEVRLWDARTGQLLQSHRVAGLVSGLMRLSLDSRTFAFSTLDGEIQLCDATTMTEPEVIHGGHVFCIACSPDGRLVASGHEDGSIFIWDAASWTVRQQLKGHERELEALAFSPDSQLLISSCYDGTIRLWAAFSGEMMRQFSLANLAWAVCITAEGRTMALTVTRLPEVEIRVWDLITAETIQILHHTTADVAHAYFSPGGQMVAATHFSGRVYLWSTKTGQMVHRIENDPMTLSHGFNQHSSLYVLTDEGIHVVPADSAAGEILLAEGGNLSDSIANLESCWHVGRRWLFQGGRGRIRLPKEYGGNSEPRSRQSREREGEREQETWLKVYE